MQELEVVELEVLELDVQQGTFAKDPTSWIHDAGPSNRPTPTR